MSPVQKASTVAGLRRGVGASSPVAAVPSRPDITPTAPGRPEKPVRITLDLDSATHRMLRDFAADSGVGASAAKVLRALLAELHADPELATRVRNRIWPIQ